LKWIHVSAPWSQGDQRLTSECSQSTRLQDLQKQFDYELFLRDVNPARDQAFQYAAQLLGAGSGWPIDLFLDPNNGPVFGAVGLKAADLDDVASQLLDAWWASPEEILERGRLARERLIREDPLDASKVLTPDLSAAEAALTPFEMSVDFEKGFVGQGDVYLFPQVYATLMARSATSKLGVFGLLNLCRSVICDPIEGGFFRVTGRLPSDAISSEMLLVENAEMIEALALVRQPSSAADFAREVAMDVLQRVQRDFLGDSVQSSTSYLGETPDRLPIRATDLLNALQPRLRQVAQVFFGLEGGVKHPWLATDVPTAAKFLNLPPVDLRNDLIEAKKQLVLFRGQKEKPTRGQATIVSLASLVVAMIEWSVAVPEWLQRAMLNPECDDRTTPRAVFARARALLALSRLAFRKSQRSTALESLKVVDELLNETNLRSEATFVQSPWGTQRVDCVDHTGTSAESLRLMALRERIELANMEGDLKTVKRLQAHRNALAAQAAARVKSLGVLSAGVIRECFQSSAEISPKMTNC
jgi:hypothetical protein